MGLLVILDKEIRGLPLNDLDKQVLAASATDSAALKIAADIEKNVNDGVGIIKKLAEDNSGLTDKYNSLLSIAQTLQAQLNAATSRCSTARPFSRKFAPATLRGLWRSGSSAFTRTTGTVG